MMEMIAQYRADAVRVEIGPDIVVEVNVERGSRAVTLKIGIPENLQGKVNIRQVDQCPKPKNSKAK
jgi:hypothetical protein